MQRKNKFLRYSLTIIFSFLIELSCINKVSDPSAVIDDFDNHSASIIGDLNFILVFYNIDQSDFALKCCSLV